MLKRAADGSKLGGWLLHVPASLPGPLRRRARLLAGLLLALLLLLPLAVALYARQPRLSRPVPALAWLVIFAGCLVLLAGYRLNRAGRYRAAAWLTVAVTGLGALAAAYVQRSEVSGKPLIVLFGLLAVLLSGLLLSPRATALLAGLYLAGVLAAPAYLPDLAPASHVNALLFASFVAAVTYASAAVRRHDEAELEARNRALQESQQRWHMFFAASPDAIVLLDPHDPAGAWPIVDCNEAVCRMNGYTRAELIGRSIDVLNTTPGRPEERAAYLARIRQQGIVRLEAVHRHKDGREYPVEVSTSLIRQGERELVLGIDRDISERKQAERRVQAFAGLVQQLSSVSTPRDAARRILAAADQLLGWDASYLVLYSAEHDAVSSILHYDVVDGQRQAVAAPPGSTQPSPMVRRVLAEGGQLLLRSDEQPSQAALVPFGDSTRRSMSLMFVPVRNGAQVTGILSIQSYTPNAYTPESLQTLQALADHAGGALDRIRAQAELQQSEGRYRHLVENANDLIYETDAMGRLIAFNPIAVRLLGYSPDELRDRHIFAFVRPEQRHAITQQYRRQLRDRTPVTYEEVPVLAKDGAEIWLGQHVHLRLAGDRAAGFQVVARDVTRRKRAEQALHEANHKLTVWVAELETRNREMNLLSRMGELLQACQTTREAQDVFLQTLQHLFPDQAGALYMFNASRNLLEAAVAWGAAAEVPPVFAPEECWALRRGQAHALGGGHVSLRCAHLADPCVAEALCVPMMAQGETLGVLHLRQAPAQPGGAPRGGHDGAPDKQAGATQRLAVTVVEQMALALSNLRLRETLRGQAIRDPLTGLFNRRYMEETLQRELARAARTQLAFAVIMLDLDHFKQFNDTHGHGAGDVALRELGRYLEAHLRGGDIACRYGGEEFTLILPECPLEAALRRAEQMREAVQHLEVRQQGQLLGAITISLGVSSFPEHGATGEALLQLADRALYQAKRAGRNRVVVAQPAAALAG